MPIKSRNRSNKIQNHGINQMSQNKQGSKIKNERNTRPIGNKATIFIFFLLLVCSMFYLLVLKAKVVDEPCTPADLPLIPIPYDNSILWGTYRPHTYFSLKMKIKNSPIFGLIFMEQFSKSFRPNEIKLHHNVENNNVVQKFGYLEHDGENFGSQQIVLNNYVLKTEFLKLDHNKNHAGRWSSRFTIVPKVNTGIIVSLFFYVAVENKNGKLKWIKKHNIVEIMDVEEIEDFSIRMPVGKSIRKHLVQTKLERLDQIEDITRKHLKIERDQNFFVHLSENNDDQKVDPDIIIFQLTVEINSMDPYVFEVIQTPKSLSNLSPLEGTVLSKHFDSKSISFNEVFNTVFKCQSADFCKSALSNMLSGLGYWNGRFLVKRHHEDTSSETKVCPAAELFSACPSRPQFPRGFLWDEGFHLLLINKWSPKLAKLSLSSWLNRMQFSGWIPREQIIGFEAESRVPAEFIPQIMNAANPPTLFVAIEDIIKTKKVEDVSFIKAILPRVELWFTWMYSSQQSEVNPEDMYWKGRSKNQDKRELNPKTLTSGLDDYPRATHPDSTERHLDIRCWLAFGSKALAKLFKTVASVSSDIKYNEKSRYYNELSEKLSNNDNLISRHFDPKTKIFADYGLHSTKVKLITKKKINKKTNQLEEKTYRVVKTRPKPQFVSDAFGYMSLFPLFLEILEPHRKELGITLEKMRDDNKDGVWTKYGLRSISKSSVYYNARNTKDDPPYWRGPIWININILTIRALKSYSEQSGPYQAKSKEIYIELKTNIYQTVFNEWKRTSFIWEQYDDVTGHGKGTRAFTGWSALAALINE